MQKDSLVNKILKDKFGSRFHDVPYGLVIGTVFPEDRSEIQSLIALANKESLKLHVVSSGKNWGFGGDQPKADFPYYLVNLSRMNKILQFNETLGYVVIQP